VAKKALRMLDGGGWKASPTLSGSDGEALRLSGGLKVALLT
jgi:hypothetical protein